MKNIQLSAMTALLIFSSIALLTNCKKDNSLPYKYESEVLNLPDQPFTYRDQQLPAHLSNLVPVLQNQVSDQGATLGRVLFYDNKLSLNNQIACASCHLQKNGFADVTRFSKGFDGGLTKRNASSIVNPAGMQTFFWDARENDLKEMVLQPIKNHIEMGMDNFDALEKKLSQLDYYKPLFQNAFGDESITRERIADAMSQFLNSMVTSNSAFDAAIPGGWGVQNPGTLTVQQQQGMNLFFGQAQCGVCHNPVTNGSFFSETFANIGLDANPADKGLGANQPGMDGMFKIPSLRNITLTAPYMHDGRFATLREVVDHYSDKIENAENLHWTLRGFDGQALRMNLSDSDKEALVAFLGALTDDHYTSDPKFSDPFK
ncbi:MAG TPA: cytochrome c peroxidase [Saprospiraceae bacterium]|nr:cytochrome c peroxidase [Saprospiraceae bacterium]HPI07472.1 cytochrome c peroxidase [Saprospiraceae bacterium]